jgi:hypothetical protein
MTCLTGPQLSGQKPRFLPAGGTLPVGALAQSATGDFGPNKHIGQKPRFLPAGGTLPVGAPAQSATGDFGPNKHTGQKPRFLPAGGTCLSAGSPEAPQATLGQ